ncbi:MAG: T9SS type A sorting domain-containing protein, partial [Calditrichaeota bacterium]|nr:T9SS type A sorting domain-containing protein [Calditrichota bacterium]
WHSVNPEDPESGELYAQKFNSQGEPQWGNEGRFIRDATIVYPNTIFSGNPDEWVIQDYQGGCYVICHSGFTAINSGGELRGGWRPNDVFLPRNQTLVRVISDGGGGFLYRVMSSEDRTNGSNKISYEGESLFEIPTSPRVEGLPGNVGASWHAGYNGGAICSWSSGDERGFCVVDDQYQLIEERFINANFRSIERQNLLLQDGSHIFKFNSNQSSFALRYDPENNTLPWGADGIEIGPIEEDHMQLWTPCAMTELTNGNIIVPYGIWNRELDQEYSCYIYCISPDGEQVWQAPIFADWLGAPRHLKPAPDGEFWVAGDMVNSGTIRNYPYFLLKADSNGNVIHENINQGANHRRISGVHTIMTRPNGQYDFFFTERDGLRLVRMGSNGIIHGPQQGELLIENNPRNYSYRHPLNSPGKNIIAWYNGETYFASLNEDGDLAWRTEVEINPNRELETTIHPNNEILYFRDLNYVEDIRQSTITGLDLNNGEIIWESQLINHGNDVKATFILALEENIFDFIDSRRSGFFINKFDLEGRPLWQEPSDHYKHENTSLFGSFPSNDGNFWIGLHQTFNGEFNTWVKKISSANGQVMDSLSLMQNPIFTDEEFRNRPVYNIVSANDNIWFIPMRVPGIDGVEQLLPIFCITRDGEILSGANGIHLFSPNGQNNEYINSKPDYQGGLWLAWTRLNQGGSQRKTYVTHIDEQCAFSDPWTRTGIRVFPDIEMDERILDIEVIDDNSLGVVSRLSDRSLGQNFTLGENFRFQVVCSEPFQSACEPPLKPVDDFRITSISPNPFNSSTKLRCQLPHPSPVKISIYDITGRLAAFYDRGLVQSGGREFTIDCANLGTGLYIIRLETNYGTLSRKIMLLK